MSTALFDDVVNQIMRETGLTDRARAEAVARMNGWVPAGDAVVPDVDEDALEKTIEHEGDKIMRALGFEVVKFSHPGKTKQTPGIADRRYYRRKRLVAAIRGVFEVPPITVWWEAKSETGRQRPDQKLFQEMVEACGEAYVLGTHEALIHWLAAQRIAVMRNGSLQLVEKLDGE